MSFTVNSLSKWRIQASVEFADFIAKEELSYEFNEEEFVAVKVRKTNTNTNTLIVSISTM
ncbi:hypothetical protein QJU45_06595 [Pasteurella atlantica]|nr:hypothetical protein [Pasteurella atlantica]MDP8099545.1 hypothetical protein [Pasteurella atlantica]MDP8107467.1 hypothetical protein [Pasteurella atlantica]MDP8117125.1 hypothetical protein [Pasteurella atlantica]